MWLSHFETIFNAVRECKVSFAYTSPLFCALHTAKGATQVNHAAPNSIEICTEGVGAIRFSSALVFSMEVNSRSAVVSESLP